MDFLFIRCNISECKCKAYQHIANYLVTYHYIIYRPVTMTLIYHYTISTQGYVLTMFKLIILQYKLIILQLKPYHYTVHQLILPMITTKVYYFVKCILFDVYAIHQQAVISEVVAAVCYYYYYLQMFLSIYFSPNNHYINCDVVILILTLIVKNLQSVITYFFLKQ